MTSTTIAVIVGEVGALIGALVPIVVYIKKLADGARCQLRSEMLRIYYKHNAENTISQFEYENFALLYDAYKALKGNSFIDKVWKEVQGWDIITKKDAAA